MLQSERLYRVIGILGATLCLTISLILLIPRLLLWSVLPDFTVFWTAGQLALTNAPSVYDIATLTWHQSWAVDPVHGPRPFPYPPTTLLFFIPMGLLPFWAAYWSWLGISIIAFWSAVRRVAKGWAVPLSLATPHVTLVMILGQMTLVVAALLIWSLTLLQSRPRLAGTLLGVAAALKPHSVLLVPIALISGRYWQALFFSAVSLCSLAVVSLLLGPHTWRAWFVALKEFPDTVGWHNLYPIGATPLMAGHALRMTPGILFVLQFASILAGAAAVWLAFKSDDTRLRLSALVIGSLLASPHGMRYDLATLAPLLTMGLLSGTLRGLLISAPLFALHAVSILPALILSLAAEFDRRHRAQGTPNA
jgi:hypothetical protein